MKVFIAMWSYEDGDYDTPQALGVYSSLDLAQEKVKAFIIEEIYNVSCDDDPSVDEMKVMSYDDLTAYYEERIMCSITFNELTVDDKLLSPIEE